MENTMGVHLFISVKLSKDFEKLTGNLTFTSPSPDPYLTLIRSFACWLGDGGPNQYRPYLINGFYTDLTLFISIILLGLARLEFWS